MEAVQIDLPTVVPNCSEWSISQEEIFSVVNRLPASSAIQYLRVVSLLGLSADCKAPTLLTNQNFLISLRRSLTESVFSTLSRKNEVTWELGQFFVCIDPVYKITPYQGHPDCSIRALCGSFFPSSSGTIGPWFETLTAAAHMISPFQDRCPPFEIIFSFPERIESVKRTLEEISGDHNKGIPTKSLTLFNEILKSRPKQYSLLVKSLVKFMNKCSKEEFAAKQLMERFLKEVESVNRFMLISGMFQPDMVLYDLAGAAITPICNKAHSTFSFTINCANGSPSLPIGFGCHSVLSTEILNDKNTNLYLFELSLEGLIHIINSVEEENVKNYQLNGLMKPSQCKTKVAQVRSPQVLILIQRWCNVYDAVSLTTNLQFLGIQAECRAKTLVNLDLVKAEIPKISTAISYIIVIRPTSGTKPISYRIETAIVDNINSQDWKTDVFYSEAAVVTYILGQTARSKNNMRSFLLSATKELSKAPES